MWFQAGCLIAFHGVHLLGDVVNFYTLEQGSSPHYSYVKPRGRSSKHLDFCKETKFAEWVRERKKKDADSVFCDVLESCSGGRTAAGGEANCVARKLHLSPRDGIFWIIAFKKSPCTFWRVSAVAFRGSSS